MPSKTRDLRTRLHNLSKDVLIDLVCEIQKSNSRHDQINDIIQQVKEAREAPQLQQFTTSSTLLQSNVNHTKKKMKSKKRQSLERPFDFSIYHQRHIALKFSYFGEEYYGLARQANTNETIEHYLFQALVLTKLIPPETIGFPKSFSRCGRTDKGVSAYGQVIGITVRSKILLSDRKYTNSNQLPGTGSEEEIDYCLYLNRVLPSTIRIWCWAPAPVHFDARFGALYRSYRFFLNFDRKFNVEQMQAAATLFCGVHDFRYLCRLDPSLDTNCVRNIYVFNVAKLKDEEIVQVDICGKAFLWHQVRCMMRVIEAVGKGNLELDQVHLLLEPERLAVKPQYEMMEALPLVLMDCAFDSVEFPFGGPENMCNVYQTYQEAREKCVIRAAIYQTKMNELKNMLVYQSEVLKFVNIFKQCSKVEKQEHVQRIKELYAGRECLAFALVHPILSQMQKRSKRYIPHAFEEKK